MDLRMRVRNVENVALMEIGGELDLHSAPQLRAALQKLVENREPRVVLDLGEVSFIDSTGIGVLVGTLKRAREMGGDLHYCGVQARVRRVFEITGLLRLLPLFDSREAALGNWSHAIADQSSGAAPNTATPATKSAENPATGVAHE